jgi:hypothetical protein
MAEAFGDRTSYAAPIRLTELEQVLHQREAARLVCAANAIGRTKQQRLEDLAGLLAMLGLYPADDPTSPGASSAFPISPFD